MSASVFMTAAATMIVMVRINVFGRLFPHAYANGSYSGGLHVMAVFRHTLAMIMANVSVSMNAAKMTTVLVRIKRARATISASLYLRILLPVNTNAAAIVVIAQMKRNAPTLNVSVTSNAAMRTIVKRGELCLDDNVCVCRTKCCDDSDCQDEFECLPVSDDVYDFENECVSAGVCDCSLPYICGQSTFACFCPYECCEDSDCGSDDGLICSNNACEVVIGVCECPSPYIL